MSTGYNCNWEFLGLYGCEEQGDCNCNEHSSRGALKAIQKSPKWCQKHVFMSIVFLKRIAQGARIDVASDSNPLLSWLLSWRGPIESYKSSRGTAQKGPRDTRCLREKMHSSPLQWRLCNHSPSRSKHYESLPVFDPQPQLRTTTTKPIISWTWSCRLL